MDAEAAFKTPSKPPEGRKSGQSGSPPSVAIPASPFMQKLGYGTGVSVYLMKRSPRGISRSPWAVKKINPKCNSNQRHTYQKRLNEEAKILKNLQHPNIVGYRAFAEAKDGSMCLAMEYGGEKSLNDLIEERSAQHQGPFPAAAILRVALHVARGLKGFPCGTVAGPLVMDRDVPRQYLHNDKKLLHGDIKSSNVVIRGDFESIKICDVGVSLPLDENMIVSNPEAHYIGTEPWKPKEALEEDGFITDKADIFAFGLTLWEMMTLSIPHLNLPGDDDELDDASFEEEDFDEDAYYEALGTRPPLSVEELGPSYQKVIELFSLCTMEDPRKRPAAAQIVEVLEAEGSIQ